MYARTHRTDGEIQVTEDRPPVPPTGRRDTDGQRKRRKRTLEQVERLSPDRKKKRAVGGS